MRLLFNVVTPADRWRGSISLAACLVAFFVAFCSANGLASDAIQLADCNFWVGIVWQGMVQPLGTCFKADWSTPEIVPIAKTDQSIPIPADWSKGVNPPPLHWRVVCQDWESNDMVMTKVKVNGERIMLQPASSILGSSCVAIQGNVKIFVPNSKAVAAGTIATLNVKDQNIRLVKERYEDGVGISLLDTNGAKIFEMSEAYGN